MLAVVVAVAACSGGSASSRATASGASPGIVTIGSPLVGKPAPALAGTTLDGAHFDLAPGGVHQHGAAQPGFDSRLVTVGEQGAHLDASRAGRSLKNGASSALILSRS